VSSSTRTFTSAQRGLPRRSAGDDQHALSGSSWTFGSRPRPPLPADLRADKRAIHGPVAPSKAGHHKAVPGMDHGRRGRRAAQGGQNNPDLACRRIFVHSSGNAPTSAPTRPAPARSSGTTRANPSPNAATATSKAPSRSRRSTCNTTGASPPWSASSASPLLIFCLIEHQARLNLAPTPRSSASTPTTTARSNPRHGSSSAPWPTCASSHPKPTNHPRSSPPTTYKYYKPDSSPSSTSIPPAHAGRRSETPCAKDGSSWSGTARRWGAGHRRDDSAGPGCWVGPDRRAGPGRSRRR